MEQEKKEPNIRVCCNCGKSIDINRTSYGSGKDAEGNETIYHLYPCTQAN